MATISARTLKWRKSLYKPIKKIVLGAGILVALLGIVLASHAFAFRNRIYPGITVGEIGVGKQTLEEAAQTLAAFLTSAPSTTLTLIVGEQTFAVSADNLKLRYSAEDSAQAAYAYGRSIMPAGRRLLIRLTSLVTSQQIPFSVRFDEARKTKLIQEIKAKVDRPAKDATLGFEANRVVVSAEQEGFRVAQEELERVLREGFGLFRTTPISVSIERVAPSIIEANLADAKAAAENVLDAELNVVVDKEVQTISGKALQRFVHFPADGKRRVRADANRDAIAAYVQKVAKGVDREPVDAKLGFVDGKVVTFELSQDGRAVNQKKGIEEIAQALTEMLRQQAPSALVTTVVGTPEPVRTAAVTLKIETKKPAVTADEVSKLGLRELIGTATTDFSGSPENRKHNIKNGVQFLNGALIKPGDTLSAVTLLGNIDNTTGYLPELVIKENQTIPEFGGGLCQVSTTLFRAALNAGLEIVERQNHSYRVGYYERPDPKNPIYGGPGLDATIYIPRPDLKIKNDTPGWILVQGKVAGDKVTFEFYGTSDGRRSEISEVEIWNITSPPAAQYTDTPDLPAGEVKQIEKPHDGAKTKRTYRVYDKDGKMIREQVFRSTYKAWQAKFLRGTGGPPPPPESPTPTP